MFRNLCIAGILASAPSLVHGYELDLGQAHEMVESFRKYGLGCVSYPPMKDIEISFDTPVDLRRSNLNSELHVVTGMSTDGLKIDEHVVEQLMSLHEFSVLHFLTDEPEDDEMLDPDSLEQKGSFSFGTDFFQTHFDEIRVQIDDQDQYCHEMGLIEGLHVVEIADVPAAYLPEGVAEGKYKLIKFDYTVTYSDGFSLVYRTNVAEATRFDHGHPEPPREEIRGTLLFDDGELPLAYFGRGDVHFRQEKEEILKQYKAWLERSIPPAGEDAEVIYRLRIW